MRFGRVLARFQNSRLLFVDFRLVLVSFIIFVGIFDHGEEEDHSKSPYHGHWVLRREWHEGKDGNQ